MLQGHDTHCTCLQYHYSKDLDPVDLRTVVKFCVLLLSVVTGDGCA